MEGWDLFQSTLGQVRISPSGTVLGIDQSAVFQVAQMKGVAFGEVFELFQEAEAAFVQSVNTKQT